MHRTFLRWIATYPIFADTELGGAATAALGAGDGGLIHSGTLAEIYLRYQLHDFYLSFINAQALRVMK